MMQCIGKIDENLCAHWVHFCWPSHIKANKALTASNMIECMHIPLWLHIFDVNNYNCTISLKNE